METEMIRNILNPWFARLESEQETRGEAPSRRQASHLPATDNTIIFNNFSSYVPAHFSPPATTRREGEESQKKAAFWAGVVFIAGAAIALGTLFTKVKKVFEDYALTKTVIGLTGGESEAVRKLAKEQLKIDAREKGKVRNWTIAAGLSGIGGAALVFGSLGAPFWLITAGTVLAIAGVALALYNLGRYYISDHSREEKHAIQYVRENFERVHQIYLSLAPIRQPSAPSEESVRSGGQ